MTPLRLLRTPRSSAKPPRRGFTLVELLVVIAIIRNSMGRVCIARHGMKINLAFADASARSIHLDELWRVYWYLGMPKVRMAVPGAWE